MEFEKIGFTPVACSSAMIVLGIALPVILAAVWRSRTKQPLKPLFIGAGTFLLFAVVLETLPKVILFNASNPLGAFIVDKIWLYGLIAALLAGLFEETGRFVAFKYWLKNYTDKRSAITYGIGHGGIEIMFLLAYGGLQALLLIFMINTGLYQKSIEQVSMTAKITNVTPEMIETLKAIPSSIASLSPFILSMSLLERTSAVLIHISCSVMVFTALRQKNMFWLFPLAIFTHTFVDIFAVMYQFKIITNLVLFELLLFAVSAALFYVVYKFIYRRIAQKNIFL